MTKKYGKSGRRSKEEASERGREKERESWSIEHAPISYRASVSWDITGCGPPKYGARCADRVNIAIFLRNRVSRALSPRTTDLDASSDPLVDVCIVRGRRLDEACSVTASQGYHSHQIETGLCIRLTLFARRLRLPRWTSLASHLYSFAFFRLVHDPLRDRMISQEDYGYSEKKRMTIGWVCIRSNWKSVRIEVKL